MIWSSFDEFFKTATGEEPYDYQSRLAAAEELPELLNVPTGAGKTAASVLGWLWRRTGGLGPEIQQRTPRWLIYCLPMRTLVDQTHEVVATYLQKLGMWGVDSETGAVGLYVTMGGDSADEWALYPEHDAIIIGTQDMLLSRALNRGYGTSRFQWPFLFGILNNNCLWVMDEVQLMGSGLATSAQLEAFRKSLGVSGPAQTIWMSATAEPAWLETVDHPTPSSQKVMTLSEADQHGQLARRLAACKTTRQCPVLLEGNSEATLVRNAAKLAREIVNHHVAGTMTLVIVNTVKKAKVIYEALGKIQKDGEVKAETILVHSQFRPHERKSLTERLTGRIDPAGPGLIAITTQVVEAGVNISARTLFTEVAPWASVVQRLGRLNRFGEYAQADAWWMDVNDKDILPYDSDELSVAKRELKKLEGQSVAPNDLPLVRLDFDPLHVIRRRDILELFDTAPDLSGNDVDVSRFIRDGEDLDVGVFWRDWDMDSPPQDLATPIRQELCAVSVAAAREFAEEKGRQFHRWDPLAKRWSPVRPRDIFPGQTFLAKAGHGGYDPVLGWNPESHEKVAVIEAPDEGIRPEQGMSDDHNSLKGRTWLTIGEHTDHVVTQLEKMLDVLYEIEQPEVAKSLRLAARYHDAGKAHGIFQDTMLRGLEGEERESRTRSLWAKRKDGKGHHRRRHFRHELVSALAALEAGLDDLSVYLCAAHHGRVRLSLRALPKESRPDRQDLRYAFGVWEEDKVPFGHQQIDLGGGVLLSPIKVKLGIMELGLTKDGQKSWTERMLALRDRPGIGPFRLAYLEALVAAADRRASAIEEEGVAQ